MKKFLMVLFILMAVNIAFSYVDLWIQPGMNWYSDGFGWNADAGIRTDVRQFFPGFPGGLFIGIDGFFSFTPTPLSNLTIMNLSGGLEAGFDFLRSAQQWGLAPYCVVGAGFFSFANIYTNVVRGGLFVAPAVRFSFPVFPFLLVGTDVSYRFQFIDLLTNTYVHQTLNASLSLTFILADNEPRYDKPAIPVVRGNIGSSLIENIREIVRTEKLPGTVTEEASHEVMLAMSDVLFDMNSDRVKPDYEKALRVLARRVREFTRVRVSVEGHTDNVGDDIYNRVLSARRARNVADIVTRSGIPAGRVSSIGYGKTRPIVPNTSAANRARNRRVEIRFREGK